MDNVTIGVEEEFFLMRGADPHPFQPDQFPLPEDFVLSYELHEPIVELVSPIYSDVMSLCHHMVSRRRWLSQVCEQEGLYYQSNGVPELSNIHNVKLRDEIAHQDLKTRYDVCSTGVLTLGMHFHFGSIPVNKTPQIFNGLRRFIPLLIALSANSKRQHDVFDGVASYRLVRMGMKPRTGIPEPMKSVSDYLSRLTIMLESDCMGSLTQHWEDIRYHPIHKTIEVRCFDTQQYHDKACSLLVLTYHLVRKLLINADFMLEDFPAETWVIKENRWRAIRRGEDALFLNAVFEQVQVKHLHHRIVRDIVPDSIKESHCEVSL